MFGMAGNRSGRKRRPSQLSSGNRLIGEALKAVPAGQDGGGGSSLELYQYEDASGPTIRYHSPGNTNPVDEGIGGYIVHGQNSSKTELQYGALNILANSYTAGAEGSRQEFTIMYNGARSNCLVVDADQSTDPVFNLSPDGLLEQTAPGPASQRLNKNTQATGEATTWAMRSRNTSDNWFEAGIVRCMVDDNTAASEDSRIVLANYIAGAEKIHLHVGNGVTVCDDTETNVSPGTGNLAITGSMEIGHATDTTLARTAAGRLTVEGVELLRPAAQSDQETGTSNILGVTPGTQHFHQSAAKCWCYWTGNSTTILKSYNMTSIANTGTGDADGTIATDFSDANWCGLVVTSDTTAAGWDSDSIESCGFNARAAGTFGVLCGNMVDGTTAVGGLVHPTQWNFVGYGDI